MRGLSSRLYDYSTMVGPLASASKWTLIFVIALNGAAFFIWLARPSRSQISQYFMSADSLAAYGNRELPSEADLPWIFVITPTKERLEQKADLTRFSQTLRLVPRIHWILVEDAVNRSSMVETLLQRSQLNYTHLAVIKDDKIGGRGMTQRNFALKWLRETFAVESDIEGVVYFADDDNSYDVLVFDYVRKVHKIGVWAVGLVGGVKVEAPRVKNGTVIGWDVGWNPNRSFAIDMAGFAINLRLILSHPDVYFHIRCKSYSFEPCFLEQFGIGLSDLEPFGFDGNSTKELLVWHTKTSSSGTKGDNKGFIV